MTLLEFRKKHKFKQWQMALLMGVPKRTYEDIERGHNSTRKIHIHALLGGILYYDKNNAEINKDLLILMGERE